MFMYQAAIWIVLILVGKAIQDDKRVPYLIPVNIGNIRYIKLIDLGSGTFSAPPLAILDIQKLSKYSCFINIRTRRYALGIPVIFWNSSYIDNLNSQRLIIDNSGKNIIKIIPPSNILKFQMIWRRPGIYENEILLDSSWYDSDLNYILPMSQTFIMEFGSGNSSENLCNKMKSELISTPTQRQELEITFKNQGLVKQKIPEVIIKSRDICSVEPINSVCNNYRYTSTYIYLTSAEQVAYDVATNIMKRDALQMLEIQKEIRKVVFEYICKTQVPYSANYMEIFGTPKVINTETKICLIPSDVKSNNDAILEAVKSITVRGQNDEFSIPILNST